MDDLLVAPAFTEQLPTAAATKILVSPEDNPPKPPPPPPSPTTAEIAPELTSPATVQYNGVSGGGAGGASFESPASPESLQSPVTSPDTSPSPALLPPPPPPPSSLLLPTKASPVIITTTTTTAAVASKTSPHGRNSAGTFGTDSLIPRPRGLSNNGNTCFFNACMQCLAQTPYLTTIFKDEVVHMPGGEFTVDTARAKAAKAANNNTAAAAAGATPSTVDVDANDDDDDGDAAVILSGSTVTKRMPPVRIEYSVRVNELLQSFKDIMEQMQVGGGTVNPSHFFGRFTSLHQQFGGGEQHDSHELLRHLLDSVLVAERRIYRQQILNTLYNQRKFRDLTPLEVQEIEFYAGQAKDRFLIRRLFQGTLESTLRCEVCANTSPNMETFLDISLPVVAAPSGSPSTSSAATAAAAAASASTSPNTGPYSRRFNKSPEHQAAAAAPTKRQLKKEKRKVKHDRKFAAAAQKSGSGAGAEASSNNNNSEEEEEEEDGDERDEEVVDATKASENSGSEPDADTVDATAEAAASETAASTAELVQTFGTFGLSRPEGVAVVLQKHSLSNGHADPSATIGLPYATRPDECSVQSCLNAFVAVELLSGANKVTCEACTKRSHRQLQWQRQQQAAAEDADDGATAAASGGASSTKPPPSVLTNATKQFLVSSLPAVLILHLKRFQIGYRHRVQKINHDVTFPLVLDMGPFCAASPQLGARQYRTVHAAQKRILYALYGVVVHQGQMGSGHYIAYVKVRPTIRAGDPRWRFVSTRHAEGAEGAEQEVGDGDAGAMNGCGDAADGGARFAAKTATSASSAAAPTMYDSDDSLTGEQVERRARAKRVMEAAAERMAAEEADVRPPDGQWYYVSDSRVTEVSVEAVLKAQAYLLFYERIF